MTIRIGPAVYLDPKTITEKAASFIRGDHLRALREICDTQKTVSTKRLWWIVQDLADDLRLDGMMLQGIAEHLRKEQGK